MSTLSLTFTLPEEREEAEIAQKGGLYYSMLYEMRQYRRTLYKYDERKSIPKEELISKLDELLCDFSE